MISSTAAAPGARAGTSKEMHQLKRKILEKNSAPSANSIPSSYMNDVRAAINDCPPPRAAKRKAQDTLTQIHEDTTVSEEEKQQRKPVIARSRKKATEKELKPGYCENCREKFNDFDEVCTSSQMTPRVLLTMTSISPPANIASLH
jgi:regulatory subunit for Cdc7p protein kinase